MAWLLLEMAHSERPDLEPTLVATLVARVAESCHRAGLIVVGVHAYEVCASRRGWLHRVVVIVDDAGERSPSDRRVVARAITEDALLDVRTEVRRV